MIVHLEVLPIQVNYIKIDDFIMVGFGYKIVLFKYNDKIISNLLHIEDSINLIVKFEELGIFVCTD